MIIGIDLRILAKNEEGGITQYLENLLPRLIQFGKNDTFKLFYNGLNKRKLNYPWLNLPNVKLYEFRFPNRLFEFLKIKIDKLLNGIDVFFSPHFLISPLSEKVKKILTIHDLSFIYYPDFFDFKRKIWHWRINPKKQINSADKIISVSQSTKNDIVNIYKIPDYKIEVIYSGIDEKFKLLDKTLPKFEEIRKKYALPKKFILYFGKLEPRKNILNIIKAFELIKPKIPELNLVIAGEKGWLYKDLNKLIELSLVKNSIFLTGKIEENDKIYIYNLAEIFIYPSFFEGFGFPPLEAMACGLATIVSNQTSLPEIVNNSALTINPFKIKEISQAIEILINNPEIKEKYKYLGLKNAKKFNWEKTAIKTWELIKNSINS